MKIYNATLKGSISSVQGRPTYPRGDALLTMSGIYSNSVGLHAKENLVAICSAGLLSGKLGRFWQIEIKVEFTYLEHYFEPLTLILNDFDKIAFN